MKITINSLEDTEHIAKIISRNLEKGSVLCLDGDLGAGKTTLTQYISKSLGIAGYITSPTFTIIKEYMGKMPLYHMDVYRIETVEEMYDIGYEEYIYSEGITIIEWSQKIESILPNDRTNIYIKRGESDDQRIFTLSGSGSVYKKIVEEMNIYENTCN